MTATDRFRIVAPLPSPRGHLHVAVDRASVPPRAVVLAFYPRAVSTEPARLERLSAEMERVAQLCHPNVVAPVGIEPVGDDLAAVTVWRDAATLREVLEAGGPLPHDIAARIAADVCAGLGHAHARAEPVVHGLLRAEAVLVDATGTAAVSGFGMPGGSGISDDLLGVGELLHECLVGKPPEHPSAPLDAPGVPASLAAVVNAACAPEREARFPTADALGEAIAGAVPLAAREEVAAHLEAIVPAGTGLRAQRRKRIEAALGAAPSVLPEEISDEDIVCAPTPAPRIAAPEPAAGTPTPAAIGRGSKLGDEAGPSISTRAPIPSAAGATAPCSAQGSGQRPQVSLRVAVAMSLGCAALGFALARLVPRDALAPSWPAAAARASADAPATAPVAGGVPGSPGTPAPTAERPVSRAAPQKKRSSVRQPAGPANGKEPRAGLLEVTAPDGAEIWLDGRRIGTGSTQRRIPEGSHRIEVRHGGAKVGESFHVASGETWTYAVTPR